MGLSTYTNQEVSEASTSGSVTITFNLKSRAVEIINDSTSDDLEYKFKLSQDFATLKPQEAMSSDFITKTVFLNSPSANSVDYRVRAIG